MILFALKEMFHSKGITAPNNYLEFNVTHVYYRLQQSLVSKYPWILGHMDTWIVGYLILFSIRIHGYLDNSTLELDIATFLLSRYLASQKGLDIHVSGYPIIRISHLYLESTSITRSRATSFNTCYSLPYLVRYPVLFQIRKVDESTFLI